MLSLLYIYKNVNAFFYCIVFGGITEVMYLTGTSVAAISASDSDIGTNAVFTFNIASGDTASKFSISGNDIVTTATAVDYEVETSFTLIIKATDQGSTANTATTTVKISVSTIHI